MADDAKRDRGEDALELQDGWNFKVQPTFYLYFLLHCLLFSIHFLVHNPVSLTSRYIFLYPFSPFVFVCASPSPYVFSFTILCVLII